MAKIYSLVLSWSDPSGTAAIEPGDPQKPSEPDQIGPTVTMANEIHIGEEENTNLAGEQS